MTDADVALDGEREREPDARVTGRVGERAPVRQPVVLVGRRHDHATLRPLQQ